jgi:predicted nuclease of predicted toxin-antitoxin system
MKLLIDMNLSPNLCAIFNAAGWDTVHWSSVGSPSAKDWEIMQWARDADRVVLTHDLDFGALLALTHAGGPSVIQVRTQNVRPRILAPLILPLLRRYGSELESGALLVVDEARWRVRLLPLPRE